MFKKIFYVFLIFLTNCGDILPSKKNKATDFVFENQNKLKQLGIPFITNLQEHIFQLQIKHFYEKNIYAQNIKIAILDNGFDGIEKSKGNTLPTDIFIDYGIYNPPLQTNHGTKLAEIVYALCTGYPFYNPQILGPKLYIFNTNGFSNFKYAIQKSIEYKVDIILYSQVWEYGGNLDGKGFINVEVNKAIENGILWINAVGNFEKNLFVSPIIFEQYEQYALWANTYNRDKAFTAIKLPYQNKYLRFNLNNDEKNNANSQNVKIVLAWNDFQDDINLNYTNFIDLDLYLEDSLGNIIEYSNNIQTNDYYKSIQENSNFSFYPKEIIKTSLYPGTYYLKVVAKNNNFNYKNKYFWITMSAYKSEFLDITDNVFPVLIPADNLNVISVGASDVERSSFGIVIGTRHSKPELSVNSTIKYSDDMEFKGSSASAAIVAAKVALMLNAFGKLSKEQVLYRFNNSNK